MLAPALSDSGNAGTALAFDSVTRRFGRRWALRGVSLSVRPGEIVGVLGHNGSGKSTLLRIAASALKPTSGRVLFGDKPAADLVDRGRSRVGLLAIQSGLYDDLTAFENMRFVSSMLDRSAATIDEVLDRVGLADFAHERVRGFSSGMQRRLALGRILLQAPSILLLDEPYNSLDTQGIDLVNAILLDSCEKGAAALVVVHDPQNAGKGARDRGGSGSGGGLFDRAVTLQNGLISDSATRDVLGAEIRGEPAGAVK